MDFTDISADVDKGKSSLLRGGETKSELFAKDSYLAGQMKDLLNVLSRDHAMSPGSASKCKDYAGFGRKTGKVAGKVKTYYYTLKGLALSYYVNKDDATPKGVYNVTYAKFDKISMRKEEIEGMEPDYAAYMESQMTSHRIIVYTSDRVHNLHFDSEEDAINWHKALTFNLKACIGDDEFEAKESAAKSMEPLIKAETKDQFYLHKNVVGLLVSSGMIADENPLTTKSKIKEGYLHMRKDDLATKGHSWKRYYYVLVGTTIYYYESTSNNEYHGVINLRACSIDIDEAYCKQEKWVFTVQTPLRKFILRAKHDGSMKEWLKVIDKQCPAESGEVLWKKFDNLSVVVSEEEVREKAEPIKGSKSLLVTTNGKGTAHKLKPGTVYTVGRDGGNKIVVDDECVSRSHMKIEVTKDDKVIATDMGSSRGTKVNDVKITSRALKINDIIAIGNSTMCLQAK